MLFLQFDGGLLFGFDSMSPMIPINVVISLEYILTCEAIQSILVFNDSPCLMMMR
jgi:hypothetical protein